MAITTELECEQAQVAEVQAARRLPRLSYPDGLGVLLGVVMLGTFLFLPWLNLPAESCTGVSLLSERLPGLEGRISIPALIPLAALSGVLFSLVSLLGLRLSRVGSALVLFSGLVGVAYFVIFFFQNADARSVTYMAGPGFWVAFFATGGLVAQIAIPRAGLDLPGLMGIGADETSEHVYLGIFGGKSALMLERIAAWIGSQPKYVAVFAWLAILTLLEVSLASIDFPLTALALVTLSGVKVLLVVGYYMHLKTDSRLFTYILLVPAPFVVILLLALLVGL